MSGLILIKAIAQLVGDPRYLRFNVLIQEDAKGSPFTDVNDKAALSPQLFRGPTRAWTLASQLENQEWWPQHHSCWYNEFPNHLLDIKDCFNLLFHVFQLLTVFMQVLIFYSTYIYCVLNISYSNLEKWNIACSNMSSHESSGIFYCVNSTRLFVSGVSVLQLEGI